MERNDSIEIEKVGNGWMILPRRDIRNDGIRNLRDIKVFQKLDGKDGESVFGFLREHFTEPKN